MYTKSLITMAAASLLSLISAAPSANIDARSTPYYGVSVNCNAADSFSTPVLEPWPVQIGELAVGDGSCSELSIDAGVVPAGVNINKVVCRAYKDDYGVQAGSKPFRTGKPARLSTNLVEVKSILCYVVE